MLEITIPAMDFFDSERQCFVSSTETTLTLEHSLLSISKWEAIWNKSLIQIVEQKQLTNEMFADYVKCMTVGKTLNDFVYRSIGMDNVKRILDYMNAPMTATTIRDDGKHNPNKRVVTSELIYYWMIACGIPFECQKWHINRLLTLIQVCSAESSPKKKRSKRDILAEHAELNAKRRAMLNSKG